jgi:hypothetical protein
MSFGCAGVGDERKAIAPWASVGKNANRVGTNARSRCFEAVGCLEPSDQIRKVHAREAGAV